MSSLIKEQIFMIRQRIAEAAQRSGRPASAVRLLAVTKTVDDQRIIQAIDTGVDMIGENYVQEARRKIELMGKSGEWHLIGHLQTNKAKYAVRLFDMIHSLDRIELARELDRRSRMEGVVTKVLIEVNISGEETKRGVAHRDALPLIREVSALENLSVQGLMTMPPWFDDPQEARPFFVALRELKERVAVENLPRVQMRELSMGMSQDYEVAVEEGATIVRIGRSIFGEREKV
ncbi:MAG: YggS family pyridoxal phosphate-dependent enzyme [Deltaproteobacteria bacterium HGW-Deltaproteobacteria-11]|nr:MAG: YggS family pyridoxal phosphate-dependent enzyme [Deltaproteobacteria bacterium HGW-Deltaproteobacteria-11]